MSDSIKKWEDLSDTEKWMATNSQAHKSIPKHYDNNKGYDVIDICTDFNLNFNRGNIIKYILRAPHKGSELEDLKKCQDYIAREIETLTKKLSDEG